MDLVAFNKKHDIVLYCTYNETTLNEINKIFNNPQQTEYTHDILAFWAGMYYWKELKNLTQAKILLWLSAKTINAALYNLTYLYREENNIDEAKRICYLGLGKGITMMYTALGDIYYTEKNYDEALRYLLLSLEKNKRYVDSTEILLGHIYRNKNDPEKAIHHYQHAYDNGNRCAATYLGNSI